MFVHAVCLTAQGPDGDPVKLLDDFMCYRLKVYRDECGFFKLCASHKILKAAGEIAGGHRKLREHATAFVSHFVQSKEKTKDELVTGRQSGKSGVPGDAMLRHLVPTRPW
jgi:hypothetical protein